MGRFTAMSIPPSGDEQSQSSARTPQSNPAGFLIPRSGASLLWMGLLLLAGLLTVFFELQQELDGLESQLIADQSGVRVKAMGEQVSLLQQRLQGLMADSVEIRLRALERNLANGQITPDLMQQFEVIKNDILALEQAASRSDGPDLPLGLTDHPRYQQIRSAAPPGRSRAELFQEISRLRTLLYLCLTGLVATGGVLLGRQWWLMQKPERLPPGEARPRPPLLTRRR